MYKLGWKSIYMINDMAEDYPQKSAAPHRLGKSRKDMNCHAEQASRYSHLSDC